MTKLSKFTQNFIAKKTLSAFVILAIVGIGGYYLITAVGKDSPANSNSITVSQVRTTGSTTSTKSSLNTTASSTNGSSSTTTTSASTPQLGSSVSTPIIVKTTNTSLTPAATSANSHSSAYTGSGINSANAYAPALVNFGSYPAASASSPGKCSFNEGFPFYVNGTGVINIPSYVSTNVAGVGPFNSSPGMYLSFSQPTQYELTGKSVSFATPYGKQVVASVHFTVNINNNALATSQTAQFTCP